MASDLLTGALLVVTTMALLLSWVRHREAAHKAFIARRAELLRYYEQQLQILHLSEQKLMTLLPKVPAAIARRIRSVIDTQNETADEVRLLFDETRKWPVDRYPNAEVRLRLEVLTSKVEGIVERSRDLIRSADAIAAVIEEIPRSA